MTASHPVRPARLRSLSQKVTLFLCALGLLITGCSSEATFQVASLETPLMNTYGSLDDLARATIKAVEDSNETALRELLVSENEFRNVIWINMDAGEVNGITVEKAYGWNVRDAQKAVNRLLYDWGGKPYKLVKAEVLKETRRFERLSVLRGVVITVRDSKGELQQWNLLNVVVEMNGRYKAIAFDE